MKKLVFFLKKLKALFLGAREFRLSVTTCFYDNALSDAYDIGREWMHRITLRRFEQC